MAGDGGSKDAAIDTDEYQVQTYPDEIVSKFMAFTGSCDPSCVSLYLEMSGGNIETAVSLYVEHQGGGVRNDIMGREKNTDPGLTNTSTFINSLKKDKGTLGIMKNNGDVRSPDCTRRMCLMDYDDGPESHHHPMLGPMTMDLIPRGDRNRLGAERMTNPFAFDNRSIASSLSGRPSAIFDARETVNRVSLAYSSTLPRQENSHFLDLTLGRYDNSGDHNDIDIYYNKTREGNDMNLTTNDQVTSESSTPLSLSHMFAPPVDLIHHIGGFQGARSSAKKSLKWLLVNVQCDSEFSSHALNRDVWRDELVESLIREGFIFWQSMDISQDGYTYAQHYKVKAFPHVSIIDPRTGRLMWKKEGWTQAHPMTSSMFAEIAADFCSRYSFDDPPVAPRNYTQDITQSSSRNSDLMTMDKPIENMTEEQQFEYAIRASIENVNTRVNNAMKKDNNNVLQNDNNKDTKCLDTYVGISKDNSIPYSPSTFEDDISSMTVGNEPLGLNGVAKIMIRMPDGKRLVRKFMEKDTVKIIYAFVAQSSKTTQSGRSFELKTGFPPRNLISDVDNTIQNLRLSGETIIFRWKD